MIFRMGLILVLVFAISGCVADIVAMRPRLEGPVAEVGLIDPGGGHVRYALKGPKYLLKKRRKSAFKKMIKHCRGEKLFQIHKEFTRGDVETPYHSTDLTPEKLLEDGHYQVESYRHIVFECVNP